jgi:hypothetical protein
LARSNVGIQLFLKLLCQSGTFVLVAPKQRRLGRANSTLKVFGAAFYKKLRKEKERRKKKE